MLPTVTTIAPGACRIAIDNAANAAMNASQGVIWSARFDFMKQLPELRLGRGRGWERNGPLLDHRGDLLERERMPEQKALADIAAHLLQRLRLSGGFDTDADSSTG